MLSGVTSLYHSPETQSLVLEDKFKLWIFYFYQINDAITQILNKQAVVRGKWGPKNAVWKLEKVSAAYKRSNLVETALPFKVSLFIHVMKTKTVCLFCLLRRRWRAPSPELHSAPLNVILEGKEGRFWSHYIYCEDITIYTIPCPAIEISRWICPQMFQLQSRGGKEKQLLCPPLSPGLHEVM